MGGRTGRSRWASLVVLVLGVGAVVVSPAKTASADPLPVSSQVSAEGYATTSTLESAVFQWCGQYLVAPCGEVETLSAPVESYPPTGTSISLSARCLTTACMGVATATFASYAASVNGHSAGWAYMAGPGFVLMTARDYVKGESITLDGVIIGSGLLATGQCFFLPRNWSVVYVHHMTVELHADGTYKVTVPDAKEPVTDPGSGKRCQRDELLVHSATWSGQAPPESFVIP